MENYDYEKLNYLLDHYEQGYIEYLERMKKSKNQPISLEKYYELAIIDSSNREIVNILEEIDKSLEMINSTIFDKE
ncbi:MAG: hypothetical protein KC550_07005 [Nanoarchaeota archaeon]|nr:hypothetical protein [Nanoarchaeota archaeon]